MENDLAMAKLLYLAKDVGAATTAVDSLKANGVSDDQIGVLANESTRIDELPEADVEDSSDVLPAFGRGIAAGGATGLVAGLAALAFPPFGLVAGGAALVATTALGGASFGAFASTLVGSSVDNSQLREFEDAIAAGQLLIIADVAESREDAVRSAMSAAHPNLTYVGDKGAPPVV